MSESDYCYEPCTAKEVHDVFFAINSTSWGWSSDWCSSIYTPIDTNSMARPFPVLHKLPRRLTSKTTNSIPRTTHRDRRTDPRWRAGRWKAKT